MALLELKNLHVALEDGTEIVKGVDLAVSPNEVHAVMGPNGSGKSTLAYALMGHPAYVITEGQILFDGEDVTELEADERAQRGLFLAFQYPHARRLLVFTFPRERALVRGAFRLMNLWLRLTGNDFRGFVHPSSEMLEVGRRHGLTPVLERQGTFWQLAALERAT